MEKRELTQPAAPHHLTLHQRELLDLEGVTEVAHFDEVSIVVETTMGEVTVCGQGLHVRRLNLEEGLLSIEGRVDSLTYRDIKKRGGFLGRILR